ncbi:Hypothetical predicted protein [Octopus vulgaris]|uniref:Uncharacterized protein n=1 Tax=Octopus vulgaris TaxID=6645 RepID=A0AA36BNT1_OCTVU|nr:Hypothetical predicted protein [Octopus vulgaris]
MRESPVGHNEHNDGKNCDYEHGKTNSSKDEHDGTNGSSDEHVKRNGCGDKHVNGNSCHDDHDTVINMLTVNGCDDKREHSSERYVLCYVHDVIYELLLIKNEKPAYPRGRDVRKEHEQHKTRNMFETYLALLCMEKNLELFQDEDD